MAYRLGIDIGGTFTDVVSVNEDTGYVSIVKTHSTPGNFSKGVLDALRLSEETTLVPPSSIEYIAHGTTVVTNTLLEGTGATTALITTRGFRDVLELRRQNRAELYNLFQDPPSILVDRHLRLEITERVDSSGQVLTPLALDEIDGLIKFLTDHKIEAVAVCLLYSFLRPEHEQILGKYLRESLPDTVVFLSCEVLPEIREYERTSTTAVCAYVGPVLEQYLKDLEGSLKSYGYPSMYLMASGGGVVSPLEALKVPANVVESGPAAGVTAAILAGEIVGHKNLISFDMGGTTAKASLIENGMPKVTTEYEVGGHGNQSRWVQGYGFPIKIPVIDIAEVSAGGGSIAWVDPGNSLRVGPKSAGAEPGPVCYGFGGTEPTVTDADLVLGYLNPDSLLGGNLPVDIDASKNSLIDTIGKPLGITHIEAAKAIVEIVNSSMVEAIRIVSVERGFDPVDFALVAFGGAGPVHAVSLAEELGIKTVIVPPAAGGFSALGLVTSDVKKDYVRTFYQVLSAANPVDIESSFKDLETEAKGMLLQTGIDKSKWHLRRTLDLRYIRQAYELNVQAPTGEYSQTSMDSTALAFHEEHLKTYGYKSEEEPVQIVSLRISASASMNQLNIAFEGGNDRWEEKTTIRDLYFSDGVDSAPEKCPVYQRTMIPSGTVLKGPCIIESPDTTIVLKHQNLAKIHHSGTVIIEVSSDE